MIGLSSVSLADREATHVAAVDPADYVLPGDVGQAGTLDAVAIATTLPVIGAGRSSWLPVRGNPFVPGSGAAGPAARSKEDPERQLIGAAACQQPRRRVQVDLRAAR